MTGSDTIRMAITHLPELPVDGDVPVFEAPWQAEAFAMVVALHERGCFSWGEWAETLGATLARNEADKTGLSYYECWMLALEDIVQARSILDVQEMAERKQDWHEAALATPHGEPIELT